MWVTFPSPIARGSEKCEAGSKLAALAMHLQSIKSGARETLFHRFDADCMRRNVERCLHFQIRYIEMYQDQSYAAAVDSKCIFSWTASERMWLWDLCRREGAGLLSVGGSEETYRRDIGDHESSTPTTQRKYLQEIWHTAPLPGPNHLSTLVHCVIFKQDAEREIQRWYWLILQHITATDIFAQGSDIYFLQIMMLTSKVNWQVICIRSHVLPRTRHLLFFLVFSALLLFFSFFFFFTLCVLPSVFFHSFSWQLVIGLVCGAVVLAPFTVFIYELVISCNFQFWCSWL